MQQVKGQIRRQIEGKEMPFITVEDGIRFGEEKVRQRLAEIEATRARMQSTQMQANPAQQFLDPEKTGTLNFNDLLAAYQQSEEAPQQENLEGQKKEPQGRGTKVLEDPVKEEQDKEKIEQAIQTRGQKPVMNAPGKDPKKEEKEKDVKENMTNKETQERVEISGHVHREEIKETDREDRKDEKELREQNLEALKREERVTGEKSQEVQAQGMPQKEIAAKSQERVYLNDYDGKEIYKETELAKERQPHKVQKNKEAGKFLGASDMGQKLQEAKIEARANRMLDAAALITHSTGRTTEFNVGKDVLQFRKEGDTTYAYKNEKMVDRDEAKNMLKDLNKGLGEKTAARLGELAVAARGNPYVQTMDKDQLTAAKREQKEAQRQGRETQDRGDK